MALTKTAGRSYSSRTNGESSMVTDGNHNPQLSHCFQVFSIYYTRFYVDLGSDMPVSVVVFVNTYDEDSCK